ncbi:YkgJ family cysteine cluster protein [Salinispirillum marinum]|uniref:YkgJ family cysteine cluster protein n=2 Tax=Saccharospirillaceae TaxID=255527 RepID=A0ABV8BKW0_9GAMM
MQCRPTCGACCIAPTISSPIPGMPEGKPAGVRCVQLLPDLRCALFGSPERPAVCSKFAADPSVCGTSASDALLILTEWEQATAPDSPAGTLERVA